MPHTLPRIMVVDNEPMMHEIFRIAFDGIYRVDGYRSGNEAVEAAQLISYPVAIVDLRMDGLSGVETLTALKRVSPALQVIILTGHACMESAISALNLGAFRYIEKPFQLQPLKQAVSDAFLRHAVEMGEMSALRPESLEGAGLVGRKADVAMQILQCKSTKEIALSLQLSPRTVEKHVESIFSILGATSRLEMIAKIKSLLRAAAILLASGLAI